MRLLPLTLLLAAIALVPPRTVAAQAAGTTSLRATPAQFAATAALQPAGILPEASRPSLVADPYQHGTRSEGVALMIVGLAGIVTGLVVDEPFITIIGAGVGGLGLYFYLR
ncbi:MAG: hypothetical protein SF070_19260 [Gemmatimonadota bacterium]|nr:hypothetical protein [Gemmatimonadota bacterium]